MRARAPGRGEGEWRDGPRLATLRREAPVSDWTILNDARIHPVLFSWRGPLPRAAVLDVLETYAPGLAGAADLVGLWTLTGGGDYLESETLLSPVGDPALGDALVETNEMLHLRGLPRSAWVFSTGSRLGAFDAEVGEYLLLQDRRPLFLVEGRYRSFDAWYVRGLRALRREWSFPEDASA